MTTLPTSQPRLDAPPETLDDDPPLSAVMTRDVVAIDAEARVPTALHVLSTAGIRHLPVVERGRCLGVLVETDLIRCLTGGGNPYTTAVAVTLRQLYRRVPELPATARVSAAARRMAADGSDVVLVIDHGQLLGVVTATDLVRVLARRDARRA